MRKIAEIRAAAEELGQALAAHQIGLIYGGARVGLMQAVAGNIKARTSLLLTKTMNFPFWSSTSSHLVDLLALI